MEQEAEKTGEIKVCKRNGERGIDWVFAGNTMTQRESTAFLDGLKRTEETQATARCLGEWGGQHVPSLSKRNWVHPWRRSVAHTVPCYQSDAMEEYKELRKIFAYQSRLPTVDLLE